jgi:hypothetical protein
MKIAMDVSPQIIGRRNLHDAGQRSRFSQIRSRDFSPSVKFTIRRMPSTVVSDASDP